MLTRVAHATLQVACQWQAKRFAGQRNQLEKVQRQKLQRLLASVNCAANPQQPDAPISWEAFREQYPVTHYADWQSAIKTQQRGGQAMADSPLVRHQPTSGSSEKLKLIPYNADFLREMDAAICPWMASLYRNHPRIKKGQHYWSVSWLPQNQFAELSGNLNDDSELLGGVKRRVIGLSQAVSSEVALASSPNDSLFATLCYLVAIPDLTVMSVWSPTFALQLLDNLPLEGEEIIGVLTTGKWGDRASALTKLTPPHAPQRAALLRQALRHSTSHMAATLWPQLALVSAWDTADAAPWAAQLAKRLPQVAYEGKGLWATEGVVTIPVNGRYPLAYRSHVYEFEDLSDGRIKAPWELKEGDEVSPIISGGNGMLRYALDDRIVVSGFWGRVPCFRFLGRRHGVDMVGEKLSPGAARKVLQAVAKSFGLETVTLLALSSNKQGESSYMAVFSLPGQSSLTRFSDQLSHEVEQALGHHFHYALARDLQQLAPARALVAADGWALNQRLAMAAGMIEGNIKPEPIRKVPQDVFWRVVGSSEKTA